MTAHVRCPISLSYCLHLWWYCTYCVLSRGSAQTNWSLHCALSALVPHDSSQAPWASETRERGGNHIGDSYGNTLTRACWSDLSDGAVFWWGSNMCWDHDCYWAAECYDFEDNLYRKKVQAWRKLFLALLWLMINNTLSEFHEQNQNDAGGWW